MKTIIIAASILAGCSSTGNGNDPVAPAYVEDKAHFLIVGMEHSARFGECEGCEVDANRIEKTMTGCYGYKGIKLVSANATKNEVKRLLLEGIEKTTEDGIFLFFYSGHGGQENLGGKEPDGSDRQDEFLCLYDTYMMDDEIWDIVSKCKGRVFMYFDACHSATMYRSVRCESEFTSEGKNAKALAVEPREISRTKGFKFRPERFVQASAMDLESSSSSPRILCWSGCEESEYSFGGKKGGTMTICMLANWKKGISYDDLWGKTRSDVQKYQDGQNPVQTRIGNFPNGIEVFK